MKRQREDDIETHKTPASCWKKPLPLAAGKEESIRSALQHVQEPQTLAAQSASEAFSQKRRARFTELSAAFEDCMRQYSPSVFKRAVVHDADKSPSRPLPQRKDQKHPRQNEDSGAQCDRHVTDHRDSSRAALPGQSTDAGSEPSNRDQLTAQQGERMYGSESRHQHMQEAACHVQQHSMKSGTASQADPAVPMSDSDQPPGPIQQRQLARLDSRTGSSSSAGKDFFAPVSIPHRSPQSPPRLQPQKPTQSDLQPLPMRALHKQLSVNSKTSGADAANAGSHTLTSDRANQARVAGVSSQRYSQAVGKQPSLASSQQPPKFGDARPGLGKSRLAVVSELSKGGGAASGGVSNDSSSKHQSKASGSGRAANTAGTQDTATAPDIHWRKAKGRQVSDAV